MQSESLSNLFPASHEDCELIERRNRFVREPTSAERPPHTNDNPSPVRQQQAMDLHTLHRQEELRGERPSVPSPAGCHVGSDPWFDWLWSLPTGTNLSPSARATGHDPRAHLKTRQQVNDYLHTRAQVGHSLKRQWTSDMSPLDALERLADPDRRRTRHHEYIGLIVCRKCGEEAIGGGKTGHRCLSDMERSASQPCHGRVSVGSGSGHTVLARRQDERFNTVSSGVNGVSFGEKLLPG